MAREPRTAVKRHADADAGARHAAHLRPLNLDRVLTFAIEQPQPFTRTEVIDANPDVVAAAARRRQRAA